METVIEFYESADGLIRLDVRADGDTVWLTRQQLAVLFGRDVKTIGKHIANARREELAEAGTVAKFAAVQQEGSREVIRRLEHCHHAHGRHERSPGERPHGGAGRADAGRMTGRRGS